MLQANIKKASAPAGILQVGFLFQYNPNLGNRKGAPKLANLLFLLLFLLDTHISITYILSNPRR